MSLSFSKAKVESPVLQKKNASTRSRPDSKPSYVKRLSFEELDSELQRDYKCSKANSSDVYIGCFGNLLSAEKREYVEKWIVLHSSVFHCKDYEVIPTSPVFSTSSRKRAQTSPVFTDIRKKRNRCNVSLTEQEDNFSSPSSTLLRCANLQEHQNKIIEKNFFNCLLQNSTCCSNITNSSSPIFNKNSYSIAKIPEKRIALRSSALHFKDDNITPASPVFDPSRGERPQTSPVLAGIRKKRSRCNISSIDRRLREKENVSSLSSTVSGRAHLKEYQKKRAEKNSFDRPFPNSPCSSNATNFSSPIFSKNSCSVAKISEDRKVSNRDVSGHSELLKLQSSPVRPREKVIVTAESPILNRNSLAFRKRRRTITEGRKIAEYSNVKTSERTDANMNTVSTINKRENTFSIKVNGRTTPEKKMHMLEEGVKPRPVNFLDNYINECKLLPNVNAPMTDSERIECERSESSNSPPKIISPQESDVQTDSDSDKTVSDLIEDPKSPDILAHDKTRGVFSRTIPTSPSKSDVAQIPSPRTTNAPEKISEDSSSFDRLSGNKSGQSDVRIGIDITPPRTRTEPIVHEIAPNSGKKRKKPKKGSLVERLQILVNREKSFLRIWRYHMSRMPLKGSCNRFVLLSIAKHWRECDRLLMECVVLQDNCDLLNLNSVEENRVANVNTQLLPVENDSQRLVTLMINLEIAGTVNVKHESSLKIYPPWEIYDRDIPTLCVLYFDLVSGFESLSNGGTKESRVTERTIIREFDCPCIRAERIVDSCETKFTNHKPNVIREIFSTKNDNANSA